MGSKRRVISILLTISLLILLLVIFIFTRNKTADYTQTLIDAFDKQEEIQVKDIFEFDFDRAYVFSDCYISGDGFAEAYDLDLSISEVEAGVSENIYRIVFVDEEGKFTYEYQYDINRIFFDNKGVIIYPNTTILLSNSIADKSLRLTFESTDYY